MLLFVRGSFLTSLSARPGCRGLLFGIPATDAVTVAGVPLVLGSMALLASYLPALCQD